MQDQANKQVAVLGTGLIGTWLVHHLHAAGFAVVAWNRTPENAAGARRHGATIVSSIREAVCDAAFVAFVLSTEEAVDAVLASADGVANSIREGTIVAEMSTTSIASKQASAELIGEAGGLFVDSPFFGSLAEAETGTLTPVVGGARSAVAAAKPYLAAFSREIVEVGEVGAGAATKLAGNLILLTLVPAVAEALALVGAAGADQRKFLDVVAKTGFGSPVVSGKGSLMVEGDFAPRGAVNTAAKDLTLIVQAAVRLGVEPASAKVALNLFSGAAALGFGDQDMAAVIKTHRRREP